MSTTPRPPQHAYQAIGTSCLLLLFLTAATPPVGAETVFPGIPLSVGATAPANVLVNMSVETPMGGAAYADQLDNPTGCTGRTTQGGGAVGACYFSTFEYKGIFDPLKCYVYNPTGTPADGRFRPDTLTTDRTCGTAQWSGNFLNWATMTAADMFIWAMTGGDRDEDTTSITLLRRARVTNNESWFPIKYLADASGATPFTGAIYITNHNAGGYQFNVGTSRGGSEHGTFQARVRVCWEAEGLERNCKPYTSGTPPTTVYKPEGLIQRNSRTMRFGAFAYTTDNAQTRDGGVLRAPMGYVGEKAMNDSGNLIDNPVNAINAANGLLIQNPLSSSTGSAPHYSGVINYINRFHRDGYKSYDPVGELFYEAIRYFKNIGRTPEYADGAPADSFPIYTNWNDPIQFHCQKNFMVAINDANPWLDKRLPGTFFTCDKAGQTGLPASFLANDCGEPSNPDTAINVTSLTNEVGELEGITPGTWVQNNTTGTDSVGFVDGQATNAGNCNNGKSVSVSDLGHVMGTCPSAGKQNSYYIAGLAYYANTTDLRSDIDGTQNVSTFMIDTQEYSSNPLSGNQNMLYLAGKYGGFTDGNDNQEPDLTAEWDSDEDGQPDNYVLASRPEKMIEGLERAFAWINAQSGSASNVAVNSVQTVGDTFSDSLAFQGVFNSADWSGDVKAYPITSSGVSPTPLWQASTQLPSPASRNIYIGKDCTGLSVEECAATPNSANFAWATLSTHQQALLLNEDILDYVRGDRSGEATNGGTFRNRGSAFGDVVHSSPAYDADTDTVFVGANDGMLHSFNAATGVERWAFIPNSVVPRLKNLASLSYAHQYYVDGDIAVSPRALTEGKNILFAALGRGGSGFVLMNVTAPGAPVVLAEVNDTSYGQILGRPAWIKTAAGPAVMFPGGYNNAGGGTSSVGMLHLIVTVGSTVTTKTIALPEGANTSDNTLASPAPFDRDGDGTVDTVYVGDRLGNVWKYDLSSDDPDDWAVSDDGSPLFVAQDADGTRQPITAPMTVYKNSYYGDPNYGKTYVAFGTGSYLTVGDPGDAQVQSWYGLVDDDDGTSLCDDAECDWRDAEILTEREFASSGTVHSTETRVFDVATAGDMADKRGWFIDLDYPSARGERIVTASRFYSLIEPVLLASSIIPTVDPCTPGGIGFLNAVSPFTGAKLTNPLFDLNGDGTFEANVGSVGFDSMPGEPVVVVDPSAAVAVLGLSSGAIESVNLNPGVAAASGRLFWQEIISQ